MLTPMTKRGADLLRSELQRLTSVERPAILKAIAEARPNVSLTESTDYETVRERQTAIDARIAELEAKLATAQVIDPAQLDAGGRCVFGATVDLEDDADGTTATWQIVGDDEADIKAGKVSVSSPIARAVIGRHPGDSFKVETPGGVKRYTVLDVRYE